VTESAKAPVAISAAKGRPMLSWVGKKPLSHVPALPAQHIETFDPTGSLAKDADGWNGWPPAYPKGGLLFHGDNKEILGHLLANGFRGKVDLVYIDPPFDSGADYVRRVSLRGPKGTAKIAGESYSLGEQIQYTDIWANDNYLQFMYERLLLLKELMAERSALALHCDWRKAHYLRCLLDEIFGEGAFQNEVVWYFYNKMHDDRKGVLPRATNSILIFSKGTPPFHDVDVPRDKAIRQLRRVKVDGRLVNLKDESGDLVYQDSDSRTLDNVWPIPLIPPADVKQKTAYPTQKPEALLEVLLSVWSDVGSLVLDCFIGSGTTAAVAQKAGRRWIGCDINKGAIQTTAKRVQSIIEEQTTEKAQVDLPTLESDDPRPAQVAFTTWRVNDYDLQIQHNEAVEIACEALGVERVRTDGFFDGTLGKALVRIIPFQHPVSPLDLEEVRRELETRPEEDRAVKVVCLGAEVGARAWVDDWNRLRKGSGAVNRIEVIELRTDERYGKLLKHEPAVARVKVSRTKKQLVVEIRDFVSPTIVERLERQAGVVRPEIEDWRWVVDCILIDTDYDGSVFNVVLADMPEKKSDLVEGRYELPLPRPEATVAVKLVDMLGEEVLVTVSPKA